MYCTEIEQSALYVTPQSHAIVLIYFDYLIVREQIVKNMSTGRKTNGTANARNRTRIF